MPSASSSHSPDFSDELAGDFLRCTQAAAGVATREQLFIWLRLHLYRFVPHELLLCRLARPGSPPVVALFNSVPLPAALEALLLEPHGAFWGQVITMTATAPGSAALDSLRRVPAQQILPEGWMARAGAAVHPLPQGDWLVLAVDPAAGGAPSLWLALALRSVGSSAAAQAGVQASAPDAAPQRAAWGLGLCLPQLYFSLTRVLGRPGATAAGALTPAPALAQAASTCTSGLTRREREVLLAVWRVGSNQAVGQRLGISALTVKNHLRSIMRKLGVQTRAQAVAEAVARQIIG